MNPECAMHQADSGTVRAKPGWMAVLTSNNKHAMADSEEAASHHKPEMWRW